MLTSRSYRLLLAALILSVAFLVPALAVEDALEPDSTSATPLVIRFLDVGQGDGILLTLPDGKVVLVDGGMPDAAADDRLRELGVEHIDLLLASHADYDHAGIHEDILQDFEVTTYLTNGLAHTSQSYARITRLAAQLVEQGKLKVYNAASFKPGQDIGSGGVGLHLMPPPPGMSGNQNDNSIGLIVTYGDFQAVMTGDSGGEETEAWMLFQAYRDLLDDVELYKAAHHGASTGDPENRRWVTKMDPEVVVISVGADNRYGHPTAEALSLYDKVEATVYRTDLHGEVTVTVEEDGSYEVGLERRVRVRSLVVPRTPAAAGEDAGDGVGGAGDSPEGNGPAAPVTDHDCPTTHPIKGNQGRNGWIYHVPGRASYAATKPEACFASEAAAVAAGYRAPRG
jgi:competence protein ComEC